jgi:hypothetical protein
MTPTDFILLLFALGICFFFILWLARNLIKVVSFIPSLPWLDHMLYRPYKGAHRGYWYRLPWNRGRF